MSAPALVMIAHGSADHRVAHVTHALRAALSELRPELAVHAAFFDKCPPSPTQIVSRLADAGVHEAVFVPLELTHAIDADPEATALVASCRDTVPDMNFVASRPIGPEISLLTILDERLRASLAAARVLELDGLVLSSASSGDVRGAALLAQARTAVVDPPPAPLPHRRRRRHGPLGDAGHPGSPLAGPPPHRGRLLLPDRRTPTSTARPTWRTAGGAVAVSEPIGPAREVLDLVLARYAFAAMDLLDQSAGRPPATRTCSTSPRSGRAPEAQDACDLGRLGGHVEVRGRPVEVHARQLLAQEFGDGPVPVPLLVGRDRRATGRRPCCSVSMARAVRLLVGVPLGPRVEVVRAVLPVLVGPLQSRQPGAPSARPCDTCRKHLMIVTPLATRSASHVVDLARSAPPRRPGRRGSSTRTISTSS